MVVVLVQFHFRLHACNGSNRTSACSNCRKHDRPQEICFYREQSESVADIVRNENNQESFQAEASHQHHPSLTLQQSQAEQPRAEQPYISEDQGSLWDLTSATFQSLGLVSATLHDKGEAVNTFGEASNISFTGEVTAAVEKKLGIPAGESP